MHPRKRKSKRESLGVSRFRDVKVWELIRDEIQGDKKVNEVIPEEKVDQVFNFANVVIHLEKVIFFGFWVCFDSFLYMFSFMPGRFIATSLQIFLSIFVRSFTINSGQAYEAIRALICIITVSILLWWCDTSLLYHWIRQQQAIRLYVLFNILEIFDKLGCSFGQDVFDALYISISSPSVFSSRDAKVFFHIGLAQLYVLAHSIILLIQLIALNVALNSRDYTLIHLLISNNVAELKGCVFKRFRPDNVFQLTCNDIVERFQLATFLMIVAVHNVYDMSLYFHLAWLSNTAKLFCFIFCFEYVIDWTKHCFVTKFNNVSYKWYPKFLAHLRYDTLRSSPCFKKKMFSEHWISQIKRIGFVPLPLACVTLRMFYPMIPYLDTAYGIGCIVSLTIFLGGVKLLVRHTLLSHCLTRVSKILNQVKSEENIDLGNAMRYEFTKLGNRIP